MIMMTKYKVIGNQEINGVAPGGTVDLDPETYNIPALVASGHVEEIKSTSGTRSPGKPEKRSGTRTDAHGGGDE